MRCTAGKENDEEVGYGKLDDKDIEIQQVLEPITNEEEGERDAMYEKFLAVAGEDEEIDWKELRYILDCSLKLELDQKGDSLTNTKTEIKGVNAAPSSTVPQTQVDGGGNGILTTILAIVCGSLCKDTPLTEFIPAPVQNIPVNAMFSDVSFSGFSKDICRSMVAMLDEDRSGRLGYKEFKVLWDGIRTWKRAWVIYDTDKSGTFNGFELRQALNSAGYRLNNRILNILMHRYGDKRAEIHFDDFMMCAIKLKTMIDIYRRKSTKEGATASFTMEEWLENTLYS